MVFKGTEQRTAEQIAQSVDSVGGMLDAFTAKEMTCFNAKVLDEHLPVAFDVLSDLVLRPRFDAEDIAKEKQVVLEEIKMEEDNPEYLIHELFTQNFWRGHPLGMPILGTPETVPQFSRDAVSECFAAWYAPNNIVITAAGNLEHARLVDLVAREFGGAARVGASRRSPAPPDTHACVEQRDKKELEQVHIVLGVPSYPLAHERRYAASLLNMILGGGMSSRLFQNIRERQGLAYAIEQRPLALHRFGRAFRVRRNFARIRGAVDSLGRARNSARIRQERSQRRGIAPRQGSPQRLDDAFARIDQRAHVQPGAPGHVLPPVYFARRNAGVDRSGHARGSPRHRARFLRARTASRSPCSAT